MLFPREDLSVKKEAAAAGRRAVAAVLAAADEGATVRDLEGVAWKCVLDLGRMLMATGLGRLCGRAAEEDIEARGLTKEQVSLRLDRDYWVTLSTTFGDVKFPWFAYRDHSASAR